MADVRPTVSRKSPATRREEMLAAAGEIALADGLEAITNRRLALDLRCAPALIHHYYPVAADLAADALMKVLVAEQDRTFADIEAIENPLQALTALLRRWVTDESTDFGLLWLDAWSLARRQIAIHQVVDAVMKSGHARLVAILVRGVSTGCFTCKDPVAAAWNLLTTLDGLIVHSSLGVNHVLVDVRKAIARQTEHQLGLAEGGIELE